MLDDLNDADLDEGPIYLENGPLTLGVRKLEDDEPEAIEGFIIEVAMWLVLEEDDEPNHVGSAFIDGDIEELRLEISALPDEEPYSAATDVFVQWVQHFVETSKMFDQLGDDLDAWADADPDDPFGGTEPADDPVPAMLEEANNQDEKDHNDIFAVMTEFGIDPNESIPDQVAELDDTERQQLYVKLRRIHREGP
jgi:hypothetical protein